MRFLLLGLLSISDGEDVVVLQPSKPTSLLAALLIHPSAVVSTDYLLRAVWDAEPPATARAALQSCVLRLRRIFTKYGIANETIEAVPGGYRMRMDRETLDLVRFRELVASARAARDADAERHTLQEALALWQGPVLANVSSRMLHRDEGPRLTEERLSVLERLCDIELARGRCREVLVEVRDAARRHPERERFAEQLVEALYRTGRQTEALAEIRSVKERLKEEFGIDPGAPLQRLELSILRGEELGGPTDHQPLTAITVRSAANESPAPRAPASHTHPAAVLPAPTTQPPPPRALNPAPQTPAPAPAPVPHTLAPPPQAAPAPAEDPAAPSAPAARAAHPSTPPAVHPVPCFTGRDIQLGALHHTLTFTGQEPGPVVISGAPGIGKTALALQAAHLTREAFPGGCFTVVLTTPDGEPLGADEARHRLPPPDSAAGRRLLVLDDAASAEQVRPLLPSAAEGVAVITSRRGLASLVATHGGFVLRLDAFDDEESYRLLVATVGAERVAAEPDAARALARVCGHFPLGLRIAAARLLTRPGLGIRDCVDWLATDPPARLSLADAPLMSVSKVFDGALRRLSPELSEAFLRLAAEQRGAVVRSSRSVPDEMLEQLADAGLIEEGPPKPYRIHSLLSVYARRQLAALPGPEVRTASAG
ncbi:BTAD domain-containing putative transcriptional regulator [Streptomyces sp. NPDC048002]|uniref:BTAD domain-containing putative transcriptional regulator n=1 Tax=Streptomyces sp. NPDC048002 TaxID=3154344 RepID=UPI0033C44D3F